MLPFKYSDLTPSFDAAEVFYVRIDPKISLSEELLSALYYQLWLPGYFGFNWDALYDCLRDLEWIPCSKVVLVHEVIPSVPVDDLKVYLEVLRDAALDWGRDEAHQLEVFFRSTDRSAVEALLMS
ncbi:barstar family protein [Pseudomonas putida]|uniref:Barstar (barnase inhibitor) domain-containing protein n=1 Tax=Pseudomonas putida TaxID=303 RepID=A0A1L5PJ11_PSEPU|nr:barstar family protein [Pseudomonas putida]APO80045.1 hypothetical protein BL240_00445 [Pseudomonas putida]